MTAISFPYGSTGLPVIFRSVDLWTQQRVVEGNTRVSCFVWAAHGMLPYLDDAKHFLENAPAEFVLEVLAVGTGRGLFFPGPPCKNLWGQAHVADSLSMTD